MSDLVAIATVLRAVSEAAESLGGPDRRIEVFPGLPHTDGAGVAAHVTSRRRGDQRRVVRTVEVWIDTWENPWEDEPGDWMAVVKGEIEVDDEAGQPQTELTEQRNVHDVLGIVSAVRECAKLVATHDVR